MPASVVSACGNFGIVGSSSGLVQSFNMQSGMARTYYEIPKNPPSGSSKWRGAKTGSVTGLATDGLNKTLIVSTMDGKLYFFDFHSGELFKDFALPSSIVTITLQRDSGLLAAICDDLVVRIVDVETRRVVRELRGFKGRILDSTFSPDSRWLVATSLDSIIRTFDIPSGRLIDGFKTPSVATSVSFSPTGDFLATSHVDSVGIFLWANRAQYSEIFFKSVKEEEIEELGMPSVQGLAEEDSVEALHSLIAVDSQDVYTTPAQLDEELMTLTLLPRSKWQTLLNIEIIQQRNKPKEPPKPPEQAPFFLPSLPGVDHRLDMAKHLTEEPSRNTKKLKTSTQTIQTEFGLKLGEEENDGNYEDFFVYVKKLSPAALDAELRTLSTWQDLMLCTTALRRRLESHRDFEAVQTLLKVFFRIHGEAFVENEDLGESLESLLEVQRKESLRLLDLVSSALGTLSFIVMATLNAPKDLEGLRSLLKNATKVKVAGIDIDGVFRGKYMSKDKFLGAANGGFGFCSVVFGWDINDMVYPKELLISNRANGYRDLLAIVDLSTYRTIPWEDDVPFFLVSFTDPDTRQPICCCPRSTLSKAVEKADQHGWKAMAGVEYEYFQFKETPQSAAEKHFVNLNALTPGMHGYSMLRTTLNKDYFNALYDQSLKFGIDIEGHHTETGPGVFESALAYTSALRMADNASLFKLLAKSIGMKHGIIPSFMAKPYGNLPGTSGHIHVSLRSKDGRNIFALGEEEIKAGGRKNAANDDTKYISEEAEQFLAGILDGLVDVVPLSFWAPNAVTYGYDSRAASIRIISPPSVPPSATRFEVRVPGADMQPHLALSAIFLLGLRGIERKLSIDLPPVSQITTVEQRKAVRKLNTSLEGATTQMMREGSVAREILGDDFVEHFGGTREHEVNLWNSAVTNWEVERYLELV
ncbi:hypothetical protein FRB97_002578 [Tulasnella sp. 331]|nr:hypothetical protein FRB97_002578 [Tulasnella sp. 331]